MTCCAESLKLLATEIETYSVTIDAGTRTVSALKGICLLLAGLALSVLLIIPSIFFTNTASLAYGCIREIFLEAFRCFKDTYTGKSEPPELKALSEELKLLSTKGAFKTDNPHRLHSKEKAQESTEESTEESPKKRK